MLLIFMGSLHQVKKKHNVIIFIWKLNMVKMGIYVCEVGKEMDYDGLSAGTNGQLAPTPLLLRAEN